MHPAATGTAGSRTAPTVAATGSPSGSVAPGGDGSSGIAVEPVPSDAGPRPTAAPAPPAAQPAQSPPVRVAIPSIGVDAPLDRLHLDATGTLVAPTTWQRAGWFADGPNPGQPGPAVVAGHVDSTSGPAVFYRLRDLVPGAGVVVTRADRTAVHFVVDELRHYPKNRFPTSVVYGPTSVAALRLVTCTGDFNSATGHYEDNLVVFAHLVPTDG